MELNPYISFNGNCEDAMNFYAKSLNGEIVNISRFGDSPMEVEEADKQKVLHSILKIGNNTIMASDAAGQKVDVGNNVTLSLSFNEEAQIDSAFQKLSQDGKVTMPLQDTFWGAKFGMLTDKFGVNWMFNYDRPKN
jgi:PhnB protein